MSERSFFDAPTVPRLITLVDGLRSGQLLLPDFQRPFVWEDEQRLRLLDSVSRGLPIGALLVWRTETHALHTLPKIGPFDLPAPRPGQWNTFLIDGHQRLCTLYAALNNDDTQGEQMREEGVRWPIFYDLDGSEGELCFALARRNQRNLPPTWLPVSTLFSRRQLFAFQRRLFEHGRPDLAERAEALANAFKDYQVPVVPLVTEELSQVTTSFVRVNSGGSRMTEAAMLRAIAPSAKGFDKGVEDILSRLAPLGWRSLDIQIIVNALKVRLGLDVYKAGPEQIDAEILKRHSSPSQSREDSEPAYALELQLLGAALVSAVDVLVNLGVGGPGALPYAYQLVALTDLFGIVAPASVTWANLSANAQDLFHKWFWATTYSGYFTGITSNRIAAAIERLHAVVEKDDAPIPADLDTIIPRHERFNFTSTRTKAAVLLQAQSTPDAAFGARLRARLGAEGANAVERIFPSIPAGHPGNRVLTTPEQLGELRRSLGAPLLSDPAVLALHAVPPEAVAELRGGGAAAETRFCDVRAAALDLAEARFLRGVGLTPEWAPTEE